MSKFKKEGKKGLPAVNTAALPDIVFMLLFFFMVTTVMRDVELKVKVKVPEATELQKLARKSLVSVIHIGSPTPKFAEIYGTSPRIQINDQFAKPKDLPEWWEMEKRPVDEKERPLMTVSLKVDIECTMGIVSEVKQQLREANALKISYAARKTDAVSN